MTCETKLLPFDFSMAFQGLEEFQWNCVTIGFNKLHGAYVEDRVCSEKKETGVT